MKQTREEQSDCAVNSKKEEGSAEVNVLPKDVVLFE